MSWTALTPHLGYRLDDSAGRWVVRLAGELDLASVEPLERLLVQALAREGWITLDLSRMVFIDARGLALLVHVHEHAAAVGGRLTIRRPHQAVRRVMDLVGLNSLLEVESPSAGMAPSDVATILDEALEGAMRIADGQFADAQFADPGGGLRIVAHRGLSDSFLDFFAIVDGDDSACAVAGTTGRPVWVRNVDTSRIFRGTPASQVMRDAGANAVASVPIIVPGGIIGMISVLRKAKTDWTRSQRRQLAEHSRLAGTVLLDCTAIG